MTISRRSGIQWQLQRYYIKPIDQRSNHVHGAIKRKNGAVFCLVRLMAPLFKTRSVRAYPKDCISGGTFVICNKECI